MQGCLAENCQLLCAWGWKCSPKDTFLVSVWLVFPDGGSSRACCCGRKGALGLKVEIIVILAILSAIR